jgi:hypothetical protein
MTNKDNQQKQFEEFQEWQRKTGNVYRSLETAKERMDRTEPVTIPRGYVIAGGIALVALVVAAFPILLFGVALGAIGAAWFTSNWKIK